MKMSLKQFSKLLWTYRSVLIFILTPVILLPLPIVLQTPESKCAYVMILMAVFWMTEVIHLAVTSLLPVILFPMIGLLGSKVVCVNYIKDISMMLIGGLMVAIAIEHSNLHKRIAIRILIAMGTQTRWLMLGFMFPTFILSMWISNTATTAMMIPIAMAVVNTLYARVSDISKTDANATGADSAGNGDLMNSTQTIDTIHSNPSIHTVDSEKTLTSTVDLNVQIIEDQKMTAGAKGAQQPKDDEYTAYVSMSKAMCLCVAYSANVGGLATLTGTPPNLVLKEYVDELYEKHGLPAPVTFTSWMVFGLPLGVVCLLVCWIWLQIYFLGIRNFTKCKTTDKDMAKKIEAVIKKEYDSLGPIRFNELAVFFHFIVLVLLWFFRKPGFITGWGSIFPPGFATDATAAITVSMCLFIFPSRLPEIFRKEKRKDKVRSVPALLDWQTVSVKMPWSLIILIGGGFALADASTKSGLTAAIGQSLMVFADLPKWVINLTVNALVAAMTEFTSNTATTTLVIPIIAEMAENIGVNTLYLTMPAACAASFAFMLPVATGPNAVVFSYGHLKVADMLKCGLLMNIVCITLLTAATNTYGTAYFKWEDPAWTISNKTSTIAPTTVNNTII